MLIFQLGIFYTAHSLFSPLSLFNLFSLRFLRMMKSSATPTVTRITGEPMEKSFFTSSFFSRGDLMGGIVPAKVKDNELSSSKHKVKQYSCKSSKTDASLESRTHFRHSPVLQTECSDSRSRRCYRLSSSTRTTWPRAALPGTRPWWHWCAHFARPTCLQHNTWLQRCT